MAFRKPFNLVAYGVSIFVLMPAVLGGCVAMREDLTPIRSDITVLERQFADFQQKAKAQPEEGSASPDTASRQQMKDMERRLAEAEKRLDALNAQLKDIRQAQPPVGAAPPEAEPVVVEPYEDGPKAPAGAGH